MPWKKMEQECADPPELETQGSANQRLSHGSKQNDLVPTPPMFSPSLEALFACQKSVFQIVPLSVAQLRAMRRPGLKVVLPDCDPRKSKPVLPKCWSICLSLLLRNVSNLAGSRSRGLAR